MDHEYRTDALFMWLGHYVGRHRSGCDGHIDRLSIEIDLIDEVRVE
jgi:hypothetical protein